MCLAGLIDWQEWLLFVELSPENLQVLSLSIAPSILDAMSFRYFTLWLREYKRRYRQWKSQIEFKKTSHPNTILPDFQYSTHLAMFYARAKQTFFTPGSEYELNLTSSLLSPFHATDAPPYPDPQVFIPIEFETRRMLEDSLRRFVQGQLSNMGNNRIICGIIVGTLLCIIGATPPLTINFVLGKDRWERLTALPGLWLGLWLIVASLNGVCLGIYLFGDLRQLRKFELARPAISKPVPLPVNHTVRPGGLAPSKPTNGSLPLHHQPRGSLHGGLRRIPSNSSEVTGETARTPSTQRSIFDGHIQISQAYYDADEIDESAMYDDNGDVAENNRNSYRVPDWTGEDEENTREGLKSFFTRDEDGNAYVSGDPGDSGSVYTATAKFIHPFESDDGDGDEGGGAFSRPEQHQRVDNFDFDLLPKRIRSRRGRSHSEDSRELASPATAVSKGAPFSVEHVARSDRSFSSVPSTPTSMMSPTPVGSPQPGLFFPPPLKLRAPDPHAPPLAPPPTNIIARFQENCSIKRQRLQPGYLESEHNYSDGDPNRPHSSSNYWTKTQKKDVDADSSNASVTRASSISTGEGDNGKHLEESSTSKEEKVRLRFKKIAAVPPFKAPLTKILSPIIQRGQWEIVIRTSVIGFLLAWLIVGSLLAVPVRAKA